MNEENKLAYKCSRHGRYEAEPEFAKLLGVSIRGRCPKCDREYERQAERRDATISVGDAFCGWFPEQLRGQYLRDNLRGIMEKAGVMPEFLGAELPDFTDSIASQAKLDQHGLLLVGGPGLGKTRLAAAIAREWILADRGQLVFALAATMVRRIWATFRDGAHENQDEVLSELTTVPLLVIDDLSHEGRPTDAVISALHEILTVRNGHVRPTVVTTNLTLDEIRERYAPSIASRLGYWRVIVMRGADRRRA